MIISPPHTLSDAEHLVDMMSPTTIRALIGYATAIQVTAIQVTDHAYHLDADNPTVRTEQGPWNAAELQGSKAQQFLESFKHDVRRFSRGGVA